MIGQGFVFKKVGDKMFDQDTAKIVRQHAFWGGLIMALPLEVVDTIGFAFILWHMYSKLCERANTKLNFGNIVAGFIVNIIVALVISFALVALPVIGWLGTGFVVYLQFYLSGKSFITTLKNIMGYDYPDKNPVAIESTVQQQPPAIPSNIQSQSAIPPAYNSQAMPQQYNQQVSPPVYNQQVAQQVYSQPQSQNSNLLTCPDCGQTVSRRADACPNCGCPISEMN